MPERRNLALWLLIFAATATSLDVRYGLAEERIEVFCHCQSKDAAKKKLIVTQPFLVSKRYWNSGEGRREIEIEWAAYLEPAAKWQTRGTAVCAETRPEDGTPIYEEAQKQWRDDFGYAIEYTAWHPTN